MNADQDLGYQNTQFGVDSKEVDCDMVQHNHSLQDSPVYIAPPVYLHDGRRAPLGVRRLIAKIQVSFIKGGLGERDLSAPALLKAYLPI